MGEEGDQPAVGISGEDGTEGEGGSGFGGEGVTLFGFEPAGNGPIGGFDTGFCGVFAFESVLQNFKLERADRTKQNAG